ncbi:MAG: type VI immunity family protein [Thermodesulfobacteriota bacterium]
MDISKECLDVIDLDGKHSVREVFVIVFYIRRTHFDVGPQIENAIFGFANLVSFEKLRFFADSEGEWLDLLKQNLPLLLDEEYGSFADTLNADIILRGIGQHPPDFYLRYAGDIRAGEDEIASYFYCWVPKDYWLEHSQEIVEFIDKLAATLPFSFGYASLAIVCDDRRRLQKLARRYQAIDISYPGSVKLDIGDKAGGSYWLTYLGKVLTETVNGVKGLQKELPKGIRIEEIATGKCRLQLGPEPIWGDVNHREDLSLYQALTAYFDNCRILHVPQRVIYFKDDLGMADQQAQEDWYRRFLEKRF